MYYNPMLVLLPNRSSQLMTLGCATHLTGPLVTSQHALPIKCQSEYSVSMVLVSCLSLTKLKAPVWFLGSCLIGTRL